MSKDIYVIYKTFTEEEHDTSKSYGEWHSESHYNFKKLSLSEGEEKITIAGNPKIGDYLFLVYALYSRGDSFGEATGCLEIVGAYDSENKAKFIKNLLEEDYDSYLKNKRGHTYGRKILDADGLPVFTDIWKGYFESLEQVVIEYLEVAP